MFRRHPLKEIFVSLGWLLYDGNNYFVTPTDGTTAGRIIYCLCERPATAGIFEIVIHLESSEQGRCYAARRILFPFLFVDFV